MNKICIRIPTCPVRHLSCSSFTRHIITGYPGLIETMVNYADKHGLKLNGCLFCYWDTDDLGLSNHLFPALFYYSIDNIRLHQSPAVSNRCIDVYELKRGYGNALTKRGS